MSAKRRRTPRDARRRSFGQNFLVDQAAIDRIVGTAEIEPDELILDVGAGRGALTLPIARAGGRVVAIEPDPVWARQLQDRALRLGLSQRVEVVVTEFESLIKPFEPYRAVSSPPFSLTTRLCRWLFDEPARGPWRADLLLQYEVARKRAISPPTSLRSAAWAPYWTFHLGRRIPRSAFRPVPGVDSALLVVRRRDPPVLPHWLAPDLRELLRPGWKPPPGQPRVM